jgi:hypothetical protein
MPPEAPITRLEAANARAVLEKVSESGLIAERRVAIVSVAAIRDRSGPRWERRREDVFAYVERKMREHVSHADLFHRLNDADFLLAMADAPPAVVQGIAMRVLEAVLLHFLGAADPGDINIQVVTAYSGGALTSEPLDPRAIARQPHFVDAPHGTQMAVSSPPAPLSPDPAEIARRTPVSFVAHGGFDLRIDFAVERIISLKQRAVAAIRIEPTVTHVAAGAIIPARHFARLADNDLAAIDQAAIDYASLYLPTSGPRTVPPIVLPATFRTLQTRKGRDTLIRVAGAAQEAVRQTVILEFVDVTTATPSGRLTEVVGLVGPLCRGVFMRVRPDRDMLAAVRGQRFNGLTLDAGDCGADSQIAAAILTFGEQARSAAPFLAAHGLPDDSFLQICQIAHMTHAGLRAAPVTVREQAA